MFWFVSYFCLNEILNACTDQHSYLLCISTSKQVFQPANQCSAHRLMVEIICFCFLTLKYLFSSISVKNGALKNVCFIGNWRINKLLLPQSACLAPIALKQRPIYVLLAPFLDQTNTIKVSTKLQTKQFISKYV